MSRDYNIDLLKIIACIAVVGLHTLQKDISILNSTLYYMCGFAVPVFFASSGAFLLNRESVTWQYVLRKVGLILRVVIIWNLLVVGVLLTSKIVRHKEFDFTFLTIPKEIFKSLMQRGTMWHFWFFGALMILYMMLPFLHKLYKNHRFVLFAVLGFFALGMQIGSVWGGTSTEVLHSNISIMDMDALFRRRWYLV